MSYDRICHVVYTEFRAIELNGNHARTFVRRSELQTELGNHDECIEDLQKAAQLFSEQENQTGYQKTQEFLSKLKK